ncbi:MAG: hypothetical protein R2828_35985 [Saprospiraceae bacterium]
MVRKQDNLMRWVVSGQNFVNAYHSVLRNKGAAGVDGVKTEALPHYLMHHWERIKTELLEGKYRPQAVRGVSIPKPQGGKRRLRYCIWKQWKRPKRRLRAFRQLGVDQSWARRFAFD